jgi:protease-4
MDLRDRILLQPWAINFEYALTYSSAVVALLQGQNPFPETNKSQWRQRNKTRFIKLEDDSNSLPDDDEDGNDDLVDPNDPDDNDEANENTLTEGSVAHMRLRGPVIKYSQFCGPRGTSDYAQELNSLATDSNCIGCVFEIESGGGEYFAVKPLADAIKNFAQQKPLIVLAGDFLCSAAYYLAIYGTEVWYQHPKAIIGSIGTMISFADVRPYFEKQGVVFHDIYATASSLKNQTHIQAQKGNYKPIIAKMLDPINDDFMGDVKMLRGKALSNNKAILQGETFFGNEALSLGMVDAAGTLKGAVARVRELAAKPKPKTSSTIQNLNMFPKTTAFLTALGGDTAFTQEELDAVNAELTEAGITAVGLFPESLVTEAATASTEVTRLTGELATASQSVLDLTANVGTITAENAALKIKVAKGPAAAAPIVGKTDPLAETPEQASAKIINSLSHNQGILTNPLFAKN